MASTNLLCISVFKKIDKDYTYIRECDSLKSLETYLMSLPKATRGLYTAEVAFIEDTPAATKKVIDFDTASYTIEDYFKEVGSFKDIEVKGTMTFTNATEIKE